MMLHRFIDDLKASTGESLRNSSIVALVGFAGFIAFGFVCAAIFIGVLRQEGAITACLSVAGIFAVIAAAIGIWHARHQQTVRAKAEAMARSAARAAASAPRFDPMMIATGVQIARAVGLKRLIPLLGLAGVAIGYLVNRATSADDADGGEEA